MTLAPRTVFADRYEVVALLGRGGMGEVYRARHVGLAKDVALKVMGARAVGDFAVRFHREARATARLDHPSCVRVFDHGRTARGIPYIAMELLDGPSLAEALRAETPSVRRALQIARGLLAGLAHAHARGVLHRDVKPENVMLVAREGHAPRAVLIDFGLAALCDEAGLTGTGMCLGSPSYVAPERLAGQPYDARCDLYAVGVILYEMIAGVRPFVGASPEEVMRNALQRPPRPLRAHRRDVSPALDAVIRRALAKDPARRFADAEEMLAALDDVPVLDELAVRVRAIPRAEEATTLELGELAPRHAAWWTRMWTWLRYGAWRFRPLAEPSGSLRG